MDWTLAVVERDFELESTIEDIEFAMEIDHKVFGHKGCCGCEKNEKRIVYNFYECSWKKHLEPRLCIAIGQAEKGIAQALNPKAEYHILQTRTMDKDRCIRAIDIWKLQGRPIKLMVSQLMEILLQ